MEMKMIIKNIKKLRKENLNSEKKINIFNKNYPKIVIFILKN